MPLMVSTETKASEPYCVLFIRNVVPLTMADTPVSEEEPLIAAATADAAVPLAKLSCSVP